MKNQFCLAFAFFCSTAAFCATPPQQTLIEIDYLLGYLEHSKCQFQRNGTWYSGDKAKQHLRKKYEYLANKNLIKSSEDFIQMGASQSSMSGKPYQVRCPDKDPVPSAQWLNDELQRFREK